MSQSSYLDFDLIIVGAGIVGLVLACALAASDLRIAIVDQHGAPLPTPEGEYDSKVSAINHASQAVFQSIGIWDLLQVLRVSPYQKMQVWDENSAAKINFSSTEIGQSSLGHIIEHSVMRQVLWQKLQHHETIRLFPNTSLAELVTAQKGVILRLANDCHLTAPLLVGADGSTSWVAKQADFLIKTKPYNQSALITTVRCEFPHQRTAWQRFLTTGPVAFLPLSDPHRCSIVWSTTPAHALALQTMELSLFDLSLSQALQNQLGKVVTCGPRQVFPLLQRHAREYIKPHIALIGDAAHTIHPLAGQGLNLGILDAACLAEVIENTHAKRKDIGSLANLRRYERWRKGENQLMLVTIKACKQLFSSHFSPIIFARTLGFRLTANVKMLKIFFMQRAMGLRGDLPKRAVFKE